MEQNKMLAQLFPRLPGALAASDACIPHTRG